MTAHGGPPEGPEATGSGRGNEQRPRDALVGKVEITFVAPCLADSAKIRLKAKVEGNLAPVMPYINARVKSARYNPRIPSLSLSRDWRTVNLFPSEITITKALNMTDAWETIEWLVSLVEGTWAERASIQPDYTMRAKPDALAVFKLLPRTNCKACGSSTCMAFAVRLAAGEARLSDCTPLLDPGRSDALQALQEALGDAAALQQPPTQETV